MSAHARIITGLAGVMTALTLSGCSMLFPSIRDADGAILKATELPSTELLLNDCFSFVDGSNNSLATVVPCAEEHDYIVIGQGSLTDATIESSGGLQNAVSAACEEHFTTFVSNAPDGAHPQQEFAVSAEEEDGVKTTRYSCLATDTEVVASG